MGTRPISITIVGWLFVVVGCASLAGHAWRTWQSGSAQDLAWVAASAAMAVAGGAYALRGRNWARWTLTAWMAGHIVLSLFHSFAELALHVALFTPLAVLLFRSSASAYYREADAGSR